MKSPERFDDGTRINGDSITPHYSEKGGHRLRGQFWRVQRQVGVEASWQMRRDMKRVPLDGSVDFQNIKL